jgi:hypothetical protein
MAWTPPPLASNMPVAGSSSDSSPLGQSPELEILRQLLVLSQRQVALLEKMAQDEDPDGQAAWVEHESDRNESPRFGGMPSSGPTRLDTPGVEGEVGPKRSQEKSKTDDLLKSAMRGAAAYLGGPLGKALALIL